MSSEPGMRKEYDFSDGLRGKYFDRLAEGSTVVVLDPDVAADFPDSEAANAALRRSGGEAASRPKPSRTT